MGIFDLPPEEKRKYNSLFLYKGGVIKKEWVKDPDFYIIHRVGVTMTCWALLLGGIAFALSYAHRFYGVFPDMSVLYDIHTMHNSSSEPKLLDVFNGLINWVGRIMLVMLIYYVIVFFKNVSFREYNMLRHTHVTSRGFEFKLWLSFLLAPFIILVVLTFIGSSFDIFLAYKSLLPLVDTASFVFIIYLISVFCLGLAAQAFFLIILFDSYIFYERIINNE